jgi:formate-dependent nitrite reductase cytochrome c552 subunit
MPESKIIPLKCSAMGRPLLVGLLVVLLGLLLPATVLAGPPDPGYQGPEKCAECHSAETEAWQNSPHALAMADIDESEHMACGEEVGTEECTCLGCHTTDFDPIERTYAYEGVSCEACHGAYVEGHPKDGVMHLDIDSSVCSDCHVETYEQWQDSLHGQTGVQCIGCHLSHSQDFRLTDEALCGACHRDRLEDFAHTAHESSEVTCTDCHLSSVTAHETAALASADQSIGRPVAPSHSFTVVSSQACVSCHGQTIHEVIPRDDLTQAANVRLLAMADRAPELAAQLEAAEQTNKSLRVMTLVSLGLGIGIGGMMGIIFMLVIGYVVQGRAKQ